jgi:predicted metal-dependent hydrolase
LIYRLVRSRRRTLSVEIHAAGTVVVRSPMRASVADIEHFLRSRFDWIAGKVAQAATARSVIPVRSAENEFYHRGGLLRWEPSSEPLRTLRRYADTLLLPASLTSTPLHVQKAVARWQRREAEGLFSELIARHLPAIGLPGLRYAGLRMRKMSRRWGSCSSSGTITLNEYLIRTPDACIESVVVHELCHLVHLHHGPTFRELNLTLMPWHREADALLDAWTSVLNDPPETTNGARSPVHQHTLGEMRTLTIRQAEALAPSLSNADVSAEAIISGVRPSI